jgi:hypothetical protein
VSEVLYERVLPEGATVRIRRLTPAGGTPVRAVVEVDRRNSGPRSVDVHRVPPALMAVESETEQGVVAALLPFVEQDGAVARLLAQRPQG